jgi:hypothetical protein
MPFVAPGAGTAAGALSGCAPAEARSDGGVAIAAAAVIAWPASTAPYPDPIARPSGRRYSVVVMSALRMSATVRFG